VSDGLRPTTLSAAGFADTRPLLPESDPRSSTLNRRVAIVVLSSLTTEQRALLMIQTANSGETS
jgi:chemotaxis protein MotB